MGLSGDAGDGGGRWWESPQLEPSHLRQHAESWNLAADAATASLLHAISQTLMSRTHEVSGALSRVVEETDRLVTTIANTNSIFHMLADTQFIENRTYQDDADTASIRDKPEPATKEAEVTEMEVVTHCQSALMDGITLAASCYDLHEIHDSDSDDEDSPASPVPIYALVDPYENRPLPFIIGSQAFLIDEKVGLCDETTSSEENSKAATLSPDETDDESEAEAGDETDRVTLASRAIPATSSRLLDDDSDSDWSGVGVVVPAGKSRPPQVSMDEDDDDDEDLFIPAKTVAGCSNKIARAPTASTDKGSVWDSDEDGDLFGKPANQQQQQQQQQQQLARNPSNNNPLGGSDVNPPPGRESGGGEVDNIRAMLGPSRPLSRPHTNTSTNNKPTIDLFASDSDDGNLFSARTTTTGKPRAGSGDVVVTQKENQPASGLFFSDDDTPLFSSHHSKDAGKGQEVISDAEEDPQPQSKVSGKMVPVGGVSIFSSAITSAIRQQKSVESEVSEDEQSNISATREEPPPLPPSSATRGQATTKKVPTIPVSAKPVSAIGGGLFDDNDDEGLFSSAIKKPTLVSTNQQITGQGDLRHGNDYDDDDNGGLFSSSFKKPAQSAIKQQSTSQPKTAPTGSKQQTSSQTPAKKEEENQLLFAGGKKEEKSNGGLFSDDDDDDDLFGIPKKDVGLSKAAETVAHGREEVAQKTKTAVKGKEDGGLFKPSDLPLPATDIQSSQPVKVPDPPKAISSSLFSSPSDDDDLFSMLKVSSGSSRSTASSSAYIREPPPIQSVSAKISKGSQQSQQLSASSAPQVKDREPADNNSVADEKGTLEGQQGKMEGQQGNVEGQKGKVEGQQGKVEGQKQGKIEGQEGKLQGQQGNKGGQLQPPPPTRLFSSPSDEDDIFSVIPKPPHCQANTPNKQSAETNTGVPDKKGKVEGQLGKKEGQLQPSHPTRLFSSPSDEDDLFSTVTKPSKPSPDMPSNLPSSKTAVPDPAKSIISTKDELQSSIFDSPEDDIFKSVKKSDANVGLFSSSNIDDDYEDIFANSGAKSSGGKSLANTGIKGKSIFDSIDDDEEDIFAIPQKDKQPPEELLSKNFPKEPNETSVEAAKYGSETIRFKSETSKPTAEKEAPPLAKDNLPDYLNAAREPAVAPSQVEKSFKSTKKPIGDVTLFGGPELAAKINKSISPNVAKEDKEKLLQEKDDVHKGSHSSEERKPTPNITKEDIKDGLPQEKSVAQKLNLGPEERKATAIEEKKLTVVERKTITISSSIFDGESEDDDELFGFGSVSTQNNKTNLVHCNSPPPLPATVDKAIGKTVDKTPVPDAQRTLEVDVRGEIQEFKMKLDTDTEIRDLRDGGNARKVTGNIDSTNATRGPSIGAEETAETKDREKRESAAIETKDNADRETRESAEVKPRKKPPVGGVSMFGGGGMGGKELLAKVKLRKTMMSLESDNSEEDEASASTITQHSTSTSFPQPSTPPPQAATKPASPLQVTAPKRPAPFDPPKSPTPLSSPSPVSPVFLPGVAPCSGGQEVGVSFDQPVSTDTTLDSINKRRVRGSQKRRPPTRAHRKSAVTDQDSPDSFHTTSLHTPAVVSVTPDISLLTSATSLHTPAISIQTQPTSLHTPATSLQTPDPCIHTPTSVHTSATFIHAPSSSVHTPTSSVNTPTASLYTPATMTTQTTTTTKTISSTTIATKGGAAVVEKNDKSNTSSALDINKPNLVVIKPKSDITKSKVDVAKPRFDLTKTDSDLDWPKSDATKLNLDATKPIAVITQPKSDITEPKLDRNKASDPLFGGSDSDEELFGGKKPKKMSQVQIPGNNSLVPNSVNKQTAIKAMGSSLFGDDDDDDDIFSSSAKKVSPPQTTPHKLPTSTPTAQLKTALQTSTEPFDDPLLGNLK